MKIKKTMKRDRTEGTGWVLFGEDPVSGRWVEKWFATEDRARLYASRRGWEVE